VQQPSGAWPLVLTTGALTPPAAFSVSGEESSQFASSLLLGAARLVHEGARPEVAVRVGGAQTSAGYYSLTVDWVRRAGFSVTEEPRVTTVSGRGHAPSASIPGDWSSLTYLLPLAWRAGLLVAHVDRAAAHPDRAFAAHLEAAGLSLGGEGAGLTAVRGRLERGVTVDASVCPDAVPAIVAVALAAPGPSRFTRCSVLRLKESDRLAGVMDLVGRLGGASQLAGDTLMVQPPARAQACEYDGRDDHRLVMAASVAGALLGVTVAIRGTGCVAKSFPSYWREAAKAGVLRVEAA
jgi:3-phosphoshikimate 1-carboxyvinyltransferase